MIRTRIKEVLAVLGLLLAVLSAAELSFRAVVPHLSKNSRTIAAAPDRAERIAAATDARTVLILGNSVSGDGVDGELLQEALRAAGTQTLIEHQPADSSAMVDWVYQLENQYIAAGAVPDMVVLPVGNPYPLTRINPQTEDLLFSFLRFSDLREYMALAQISGLEDQAATYAGKLSALYAFRGRLQKRVLSTVFPGFPALRMAMLDARSSGDAAVTTVWAERMHTLADAHHIEVVVVAMPTAPLEGRVSDADRALCARLGWQVLEPAIGQAFDAGDRPDGLHLTEEAAARFTRLLAEHLEPLVISLGTTP